MAGGYTFDRIETVQETTIERFGGVDFATHPSKVDWSRSPDAKNMLARNTHFLVKRTGYKRLMNVSHPVYGLFSLPDGAILCHAGDSLYYVNPEDATWISLYRGVAEQGPSAAFVMAGSVWFLDGRAYLQLEWDQTKTGSLAWTVQKAENSAFVPTTTINSPPAGGGASFEAVNLLTPKRINTFVGDGAAKTFCLDTGGIDHTAVTATVDGAAASVASVDYDKGEVTLTAAPPDGKGLANVTITFAKTEQGYADKINHCRIFGLYGGKNDTRVFLAGNPGEPNCDWQSGLYDPTYFPDTGYTRIGTDDCAIMGYIKQYESQIVIKQGTDTASSQYLRTFLMEDDGTPLYPLKQGARGAGAVSLAAFGELCGTPLFLSRSGVMGIYGTDVAEQRNVQAVSHAVSARLCAEKGLENACAAVWEDKYYLAVNGHCYVADGLQQEADGAPAWYYFDNIPASCMLAHGRRLYFGTADGRICRFCTEDEEDAYLDDGDAIDAYWTTPVLSMGAWAHDKTLRECFPVLIPYTRSGVTVQQTGDDSVEAVLTRNLDLFSFVTMDFSRFSFRCIPGAVPFRIRRRLHRFGTLQLRIGNDRAGEPFGLLAIVLRYTTGGRVK